METIYGAIEGGGTKFVCAVGHGPDAIHAETCFETTTPQETIPRVIHFFREQEHKFGRLAAIGFACFGPLDPNPGSPTYGHILSTPKPGWSNSNVVQILSDAFAVPVAFDTDVNGAALGEWHWGNAQGLHTFIYLTVGTGIGGGAYVEGKLHHGLLHPEMGHILIQHDRERDPFTGACPFHGDCLEGLASGLAMEKRWGIKGRFLASEHVAWDIEGEYLAMAMTNFALTLSPQRIILGGGVGSVPHLLPRVQIKTRALLNGYIQSPTILENIEGYIVNPGLGNRAGVLGALALAKQAV